MRVIVSAAMRARASCLLPPVSKIQYDKTNLYTIAYGQSNELHNPKFVSYSIYNATAIEH